MFDIVKDFVNQFFEYLPILSIICILLSIIGNLTFRRR